MLVLQNIYVPVMQLQGIPSDKACMHAWHASSLNSGDWFPYLVNNNQVDVACLLLQCHAKMEL